MKKVLFTIVSCLAFCIAFAQEEQMEPDRPGETETPHTVKLKYIQIETGIHGEKTDEYDSYFNHPTALIKYGLAKWLELRLQLKYSTEREHYIPNEKVTRGIEPVTFGFKAALWEEKGWLPKTSVIVQAGFPQLASKAFRATYLSPDLRLAFVNNVSKTVSINYNAGVMWDGSDTLAKWQYTFAPQIKLSDNLQAFVEVYGSFQSGWNEHTLDGGFQYYINSNFALDISSGFGLNDLAPKFFVALGGAIRFR